ncbi:acyltransferase [Pseudanabaena biceps]|nr:acyltransferase [Pseudanabaena biceps]
MFTRFWALIRRLSVGLLFSRCGYYIIIRWRREFDNFRSVYIKKSLKSCGSNVGFQFPLCLNQLENIEIGDDVSFCAYVHVWGLGGVKIGNRVMIGSHSAITSITHDYHSEVMYSTNLTNPVIIGDDVWIGSHAVILPGITIGNGAVIGAGCVVTKNVEPFDIVVGVPSRVLRKRLLINER